MVLKFSLIFVIKTYEMYQLSLYWKVETGCFSDTQRASDTNPKSCDSDF